MKRVNQILNIIMGGFVGVFIGHSMYKYWDFHTHPGLYAIQSAPWHTSILIDGIFTFIVLAICIVLKAIFRKIKK